MYELVNGSARLVGALERMKEDPERINQLASVLYYEPSQLVQDIQALEDYYSQSREQEDN